MKLLCIPQTLFLYWGSKNKKLKKFIKNNYYDTWLEKTSSRETFILEKKLKSRDWQEGIDDLTFHYLESDAKSNPQHHSEIIYSHQIQYSFARNISFSLSVLFIILAIVLVYHLFWGLIIGVFLAQSKLVEKFAFLVCRSLIPLFCFFYCPLLAFCSY
jgi:hypothetical protein